MSHTAFGEFFPEIADKETRVVTVIDQELTGLPLGAYALIDLYCTDLDCDCRNVFIKVVHEGFPGPVATINYGWEKLSYYKEWMGGEEQRIKRFVIFNDLFICFRSKAKATGYLYSFDPG